MFVDRGMSRGIPACIEHKSAEYTASTKRVAKEAFDALSNAFDREISSLGGLVPPTKLQSLFGSAQAKKERLTAVLRNPKYSPIVLDKCREASFRHDVTLLGLEEDLEVFLEEEVSKLKISFFRSCEDVQRLYLKYVEAKEDGSILKVQEMQMLLSSLRFVEEPKYVFLIQEGSSHPTIQSTIELVSRLYINLELERSALCAELIGVIQAGNRLSEQSLKEALGLLRVNIRPEEGLIQEKARLLVSLASLPESKKSEPARFSLSMTSVLVGGVAVASFVAMSLFAVFKKS